MELLVFNSFFPRREPYTCTILRCWDPHPHPATELSALPGCVRDRNGQHREGVANAPNQKTAPTCNCTIPFGPLPYRIQHALPTPTILTKKRGNVRPNGISDPQGQEKSKHELPRIHHELAINFHRLIASQQQRGAPTDTPKV